MELAWGQVGVSDASVEHPILNDLVARLQDGARETSPCFAMEEKPDSCLLNVISTPDSSSCATELGVLLQYPYTDVRTWESFVRSLHLSNAEMVPLENQNSPDSGSSAAGNLLWLLQSLGRTYSRTRELLDVHPHPRPTLTVPRMPPQSTLSSWSSAT